MEVILGLMIAVGLVTAIGLGLRLTRILPGLVTGTLVQVKDALVQVKEAPHQVGALVTKSLTTSIDGYAAALLGRFTDVLLEVQRNAQGLRAEGAEVRRQVLQAQETEQTIRALAASLEQTIQELAASTALGMSERVQQAEKAAQRAEDAIQRIEAVTQRLMAEGIAQSDRMENLVRQVAVCLDGHRDQVSRVFNENAEGLDARMDALADLHEAAVTAAGAHRDALGALAEHVTRSVQVALDAGAAAQQAKQAVESQIQQANATQESVRTLHETATSLAKTAEAAAQQATEAARKVRGLPTHFHPTQDPSHPGFNSVSGSPFDVVRK